MIRLVCQFDDPETRASVATPTCGGCCSSCCCCCCVATAISTSAYTAMNLRRYALELEADTGRSPSPWPEIFGALALAQAIALGIALAYLGIGAWAAIVALVDWFVTLLALYSWVRAEAWGYAAATIVLAPFAVLLEVLVGAGFVLGGAGGIVAYVLLACVVAAGLSYLWYRHLLG
jgi:hypothetical protein